jgi:hypothetical protein
MLFAIKRTIRIPAYHNFKALFEVLIMTKENVDCCKHNNSFVGIGASLAGIFMIIAVLFLIFAGNQLIYLVSIAWAFVFLGIFLGLFSYLAMKNSGKK